MKIEYTLGSITSPDLGEVADPNLEIVLRGQWVHVLVCELNEQIKTVRDLGADIRISEDYDIAGYSRVGVEISQEV